MPEMARCGEGGGDARNWDEEGYRKSILRERELRCRTVFRTAFAPSLNPTPETLVVASSDGSLASYSISACIASATQLMVFNRNIDEKPVPDFWLAEPLSMIQGHKGPAYDLKFYHVGEECLLLSCGDDGRIRGWKWADVLNSDVSMGMQGNHLKPLLDLVNPQHEGPWGALSPIPENNAIAVNEQIITGSEDGTARIWDCRSGSCTQVIHPEKNHKLKDCSWVSSVAIDSSESWLACGSGSGLSVWSVLSRECIFSTDCCFPVQDLLFQDNQVLTVGSEPVLTRFSIYGVVLSQIKCAPQSAFSISLHPSGVVAVGGYGGLVDVISEFGSHLCTFCCQGMD